jgi:two-component system, OmpR family, response regulator
MSSEGRAERAGYFPTSPQFNWDSGHCWHDPCLKYSPLLGREEMFGRFKRLLYVDDNRDAADTAVLLFGLVGFETRSCYDGPSALAVAERFDPGVCILDLNMPGMDGDELAGKLRTQAGEKPILLIAITAMSDETSRKRIVAAGFHFHLVKPADLNFVMELLNGNWRKTGVLPRPLSE